MEKHGAELLLQQILSNTSVTFREEQWGAIDAVTNQRQKLLVVWYAGWGRNAVYFIVGKISRDHGAGSTIIISPLLTPMRNQIAAAKRLNIMAKTLSSINREEWRRTSDRLLQGGVDCLLISPERLANQDFLETVLYPATSRVGLLVANEAHCISDWGRDFYPDYRRILDILRQLSVNTPILNTAATVNSCVVEDIRQQSGDIVIQRGTPARESLALNALVLGERSSRLTWLTAVIPQSSKSGTVYTLTTRGTEPVAKWLRKNGISAFAYYSGVTCEGVEDSNTARKYLEQTLLANEVRVLVTTTTLGTGFDKPDLGFVVHYQMSRSIVGHCQQVGHAGRVINSIVGILLCGGEDRAIRQFFRESAFPTETQVHKILNVLSENDSLTL